ncbi:tryptophan--tRNA ligase [Pseudonocardia spirodelae]
MDSFAATVARMPALRAAVAADPSAHRVLTGERPTGPLHLGHLAGTISERVRLQRCGVDVLVILADYQVVTDRDVADRLAEHVRGAVLDQLAAGLDPDRTTVFVHSAVPALNQLMLPFLSLVTEAELHRNPTVKAEHAASGRALSGLLLTYPVHQAADILSCRADLVPVGKDQLPHVELTRVLARRFAERYGPVFTPPEPMLTDAPELPGLDGQKMSKSRGNAIALGASADETVALVRRARTDSQRRITVDPQGRPGVYGLLATAALCLGRDPAELAETLDGAAALKRVTADAVNDHLAGHRARRAELARDPGLVDDVLARGNARANELAGRTLDDVRDAMGMRYGSARPVPAR